MFLQMLPGPHLHVPSLPDAPEWLRIPSFTARWLREGWIHVAILGSPAGLRLGVSPSRLSDKPESICSSNHLQILLDETLTFMTLHYQFWVYLF